MKTHSVKCWPEFFEPIKAGLKTFDVRKDDRGYQVDDWLLLQEWNPQTKEYTGRGLLAVVVYILRSLDAPFDGFMQAGYVVMAIRVMREHETTAATPTAKGLKAAGRIVHWYVLDDDNEPAAVCGAGPPNWFSANPLDVTCTECRNKLPKMKGKNAR